MRGCYGILLLIWLTFAPVAVRADYNTTALDISKLVSELQFVAVARVTKCVDGETVCPQEIFVTLHVERMIKGDVETESLTLSSSPDLYFDLPHTVPAGTRVLALFTIHEANLYGFVLPMGQPDALGFAAQRYIELLLKPDGVEKDAALLVFIRTELRDPDLHEIMRFSLANELLNRVRLEDRLDAELENIVFKASIRARYASTGLCRVLEKLQSPRLIKACLASTVTSFYELPPSIIEFAMRHPAIRSAVVERFCTEDDPNRLWYWRQQLPWNDLDTLRKDLKTVWAQNKSARPVIEDTLRHRSSPLHDFLEELRKVE